MKTNRREFFQTVGAGIASLGLSARVPPAAAQAQKNASESGSRIKLGRTKIIDIHAHIVSADVKRYPITPLEGKRSEWSEKRAVTFEQMIAAMDGAGVDKAVLVHSSTTYGYDCSYVADSIARLPQRVTGVASPDLMAGDAAQKIRYWVKERNCAGLRFYIDRGRHA